MGSCEVSELLAVELDAATAGHVARALVRYVESERVAARDVPPAVMELANHAIHVSSRQVTPDVRVRLAEWVADLQGGPHDKPLLVTKGEAGRMLSLSPRAVDRLLASGELPRCQLGGSVRIAVADIEALITRRKEA